VLSSGYQAQTAARAARARAYQVFFLPKPYSMSELVQAVEQARRQVSEGK